MPTHDSDLLEQLYDAAVRLSTARQARDYARDTFEISCCQREIRLAHNEVCDLAEQIYVLRNT
jgi:hypothetical protein